MRILRLSCFIVCLLFVGGLLGCNAEQEAISQVTKPRVLAVQAAPPEIEVGASSTLRLLLADETGPLEDGAEVAWVVLSGDFAAVPDPLALDMDIASAVVDFRLPLDVAHGGASLTVTATETQANNEIDDMNGLDPYEDRNLTVFALVCAGGVLPATTEALLSRLMEFFSGEVEEYNGVCDGAGDGLIILKQVVISRPDKPAADVNHNPEIYSVSMEDYELSSELGDEVQAEHICQGTDGCREEVRLQARLTTDSFETYPSDFIEERIDEVAYVSWFVTGGKLSVDRSGVAGPPLSSDESWGPFEVSWFPPREGGEVDLWCVAHDVRGGVSWWRTRLSAVATVAP